MGKREKTANVGGVAFATWGFLSLARAGLLAASWGCLPWPHSFFSTTWRRTPCFSWPMGKRAQDIVGAGQLLSNISKALSLAGPLRLFLIPAATTLRASGLEKLGMMN